MNEKTPKIRLWNRLLILVLVIIAGLVVLFFVLSYQKDIYLDTTFSYTPGYDDTDDYALADTFASDLVRCNDSITLEGVTMNEASERALLFDLNSNEALFTQGIYNTAYPASLTKLMTAILTMKYADMDEIVTMTNADFDLEEGSQNSGMVPGDRVTMRELFNCLVVYSANDAAMAIARTIDGSVEQFVDHMNEEALKLGMIQTHFTNPHGLQDNEHYTCAYDVYIMLNEAVKYQDFKDVMGLSSYQLSGKHVDGTDFSIYLDSTDKYLTGEKQLPPDITLWGGKTGTTSEAGACLAVMVQSKKGIPYIAVIMNAYNRTILYEDMNKLLTAAANASL